MKTFGRVGNVIPMLSCYLDTYIAIFLIFVLKKQRIILIYSHKQLLGVIYFTRMTLAGSFLRSSLHLKTCESNVSRTGGVEVLFF